ncbi:MAG: OsmC family protein [Solirubrobacteraceae bacterium]
MKVTLKQQNGLFYFLGKSENGVEVKIDASPDIGGEEKGVRPMELLLYGIGGCSAIDVVLVLKKQKEEVTNISLEIEGFREKIGEASPFKKINVHFIIEGKNISSSKVERAIKLSMEKYCSATKTLEAGVEITHSYTILEG